MFERYDHVHIFSEKEAEDKDVCNRKYVAPCLIAVQREVWAPASRVSHLARLHHPTAESLTEVYEALLSCGVKRTFKNVLLVLEIGFKA